MHLKPFKSRFFLMWIFFILVFNIGLVPFLLSMVMRCKFPQSSSVHYHLASKERSMTTEAEFQYGTTAPVHWIVHSRQTSIVYKVHKIERGHISFLKVWVGKSCNLFKMENFVMIFHSLIYALCLIWVIFSGVVWHLKPH